MPRIGRGVVNLSLSPEMRGRLDEIRDTFGMTTTDVIMIFLANTTPEGALERAKQALPLPEGEREWTSAIVGEAKARWIELARQTKMEMSRVFEAFVLTVSDEEIASFLGEPEPEIDW
jgi:antitoxin component of RelBE/YafQ-DinJ toxin-antitoxin module